ADQDCAPGEICVTSVCVTPTPSPTTTPTSTATRTPTSTPTITASATPTTSYFAAVLGDSPAAYWRLGESPRVTIATHDSVNHNNGTYLNGPTLGVAGALSNDSNTAVDFSTTTDCVQVNDASPLRLTSSFAIELWVKLDSAGQGSKYAIQKGNHYSVIY